MVIYSWFTQLENGDFPSFFVSLPEGIRQECMRSCQGFSIFKSDTLWFAETWFSEIHTKLKNLIFSDFPIF